MIARETLAALSLFDNAGPGVITALSARGSEVAYLPGAILFRTGSAPRGWYIVVEGLVRVVRGSGPRQHIVHTEGPGGTLGEVPLILGAHHPATAIAAEPTRCIIFDRPSLESAMAECPEIGFLLARRLAMRVRDLVARLDGRSSKSVRARLIEFLLERQPSRESDTISVGMTQQRLAEELGTVREVVSREIRRLMHDKLIASVGGGRYRILDAMGLQKARDESFTA